MSIKSGFFNSMLKNGVQDRLYNAVDITNYFDKIIGNGVFVNPANSLQILANEGMNVVCKPGKGWINGFYIINDADLLLTIDPADVVLNRIDRIVFRLDKTNREVSILIKKGTLASEPVAPEIVRTEEIQEYSLATIYINKQITAITQSIITDTRLDSNVCGKVACLIDQVDTSDLYAQWEDAFTRFYEDSTKSFNTWFDGIKETLTTKVMLQKYSSRFVAPEDNTTNIPINIANYIHGLDILEVYINGMRILETEDYIANETTVILSKAVSAGAEIDVIVLKNVDGTEAETVIGQVADLEERVAVIEKYIYETTRSE